MGGIGSGRWLRRDSRTTTESQHWIDIRWLKKQKYLRPGTFGSLSWEMRDEETGSIRYRMEENRMVLYYRNRSHGGEWEDVEQAITFDRTPCNNGGHRTWFLCSQCRGRVAVLYGNGKYFLCRHCYGLAYSSQQESRLDRLMRKARKIRRQLGGGVNLLDPFPWKPKGMHWNTYWRLRQKSERAHNQSWVIMGQRLDNIF